MPFPFSKFSLKTEVDHISKGVLVADGSILEPAKGELTSRFTSFDALASSDNRISSAPVAAANKAPESCWMLFNL